MARLLSAPRIAAALALAWLVITGGIASAADATVAADGTGQFKSVQEAINAAPQTTSAARRWTILVKPGTYKEIIYVQREKRFVHLVGEDAARTIITYDLHANLKGLDGKPIGTFRTPTVTIDADDFAVENLTFENSAGAVGQALALRTDGDRVTFRNCRFLGWQDTIFLNRGRQHFENCYIAGHVDFIFGGATAFFDRCHIHARGDGYITAASTPEQQTYGFVFSNCKITGESPAVKTYLGRPWRPFSHTVFLNTEMSDTVRAEGWHNWGYATREKTVRYAEFSSTGAGANPKARAAWVKQLTAAEAGAITPARVLGGADGWKPTADVTRDDDPQPTVRQSAGGISPADACAPDARLTRNIEYSRAAGESLRLDACVPAGAGHFPAAILVHGGGWSGGDKTKGVDPLFAPFARAGVAWFSIDYRLAPKHRYPAPVEDIEAAIRWVKSRAAEFKIDPARLALIGESAGGHLVAMVAVRGGGDTRVAAVVPFYAPVDLEADVRRRGGLSLSLKNLFDRTVIDDATLRLLREASPINHVRPGLPPFLLVHGTGDPSVLYDQSTRLRARLREANVPCDLITIDGGSHGMARWEAIDPAYKDAVVAWVKEKLGGAERARSVAR